MKEHRTNGVPFCSLSRNSYYIMPGIIGGICW